MSKAKQPHTAVILLKIEVYPNLDTGECSGNPLLPQELEEAGIKNVQVVSIKGFDRFDCIKRVGDAINSLRSN